MRKGPTPTVEQFMDRLERNAQHLGQLKEHTETLEAYRELDAEGFRHWLLNRVILPCI